MHRVLRRSRRGLAPVLVAAALLGFIVLPTASASGAETIEVWTHIVLGSGTIGEQLQKMIERFADETGIQVIVATQPYETYTDKFLVAAAGGSVPDVWWTTTPAEHGRQGLLMRLDDFIERSDVIDWDDFFGAPKFHSTDSFLGGIYGIPLETDARVLVWNQDLFLENGLPDDQPPIYWDELMAYTQKLTRLTADDLTRAGFEFTGEGQWFLIWLGTGGGTLWDESSIPPVAVPNVEAMVRGYTFVQDTVNLLGGPQLYAAYTADGGARYSRFYTTTAMMVAGSWELRYLINNFPDLRFGVGHIPYHREFGRRYTLSGGWSLTIPQGASNPEGAWRFIEFMTRTPSIVEWAATNGYVPPRYSAAEWYEFQSWPEQQVLEVAMHGQEWPPSYGASYDWFAGFLDVLAGNQAPEVTARRVKESMQVAANEFFAKWLEESGD